MDGRTPIRHVPASSPLSAELSNPMQNDRDSGSIIALDSVRELGLSKETMRLSASASTGAVLRVGLVQSLLPADPTRHRKSRSVKLQKSTDGFSSSLAALSSNQALTFGGGVALVPKTTINLPRSAMIVVASADVQLWGKTRTGACKSNSIVQARFSSLLAFHASTIEVASASDTAAAAA